MLSSQIPNIILESIKTN